MVKLTERQKIEILCMIGYGDRMRTQAEVVHLFNATHPDLPPINQSMVSRIEAKFREFGHVRDLAKSGRPSPPEDQQLNVLLAVQENHHSTLREIAFSYDISVSTVQKVLRKTKHHPYKVCQVHELSEDDFDRRNQFCDQMQQLCNNDNNFVKRIIFSDEATFVLNGHVNRQNCRYWATENPRWMMEYHTQNPQKINVWCGIVDGRILGPYFFDEILTGERYLHFLRDDLIPALIALYPNPEEPDLPRNDLFFQQDGAPPHYAAPVRAYLDQVFTNRWIGRRGAIEWPARSPDLSPLDYFLWGYLKSKVYITRPANLDDLKTKIRQEIRRISPEIVDSVQKEFICRLGYCQVANGAHFEHLI
jgi:predicted DNA-binding protein YlxM (UPF0122 family)